MDLKNSPYAGFDPEKDPYLQRHRKQPSFEYDPDKNIAYDLARHSNITARNLLGLTLGLMGDIDPMLGPSGTAGDAIKDLGINERDSVIPNSEDLAAYFGGDVEHPSWLPAAFVAPGPGEVKSATAAIKGLVSEAATHAPDLAMVLFHGTPHKFSKFDLDAIGTGEGAQAYGHGLYFAESPGVAKSYRNQLSETGPHFNVTMPDGKSMTVAASPMTHAATGAQMADPQLSKMAESLWMQLAVKHGFDDAAAMKASNEIADVLGSKSSVKAARSALSDDGKKAFDLLDVEFKQGGHLYEVDIPDEITAKMLDWDAPLSEQPEAVLAAIRSDPYMNKRVAGAIDSFGEKGGRGESIYTMLNDKMMQEGIPAKAAEEASSKWLNEAGIPGIRFYDGSSRGKADDFVQLYHGYPSDVADSVRERGIAASGNRERGATFATSKPDIAMAYVERGGEKSLKGKSRLAYVPDSERNVAVLRIPRDWYDKHMVQTRAGGLAPEVGFDTDIPPEFIHTVIEGDRQAVYKLPVTDLNNLPDAKTRNIVVFNPDDIKSVKRDGELVYREKTKLEETIELVDKY